MRSVLALFFAFVFSSPAMNPVENRLVTQMRSWQHRLGLDEWNLSLRVVRQSQIDPNAWGAAEWDPDSRSGVISVLDPRDYNLRGGELKLDMECTIVHELVHIQVSPLAGRDERTTEEVVNRIMTALINRQCPN